MRQHLPGIDQESSRETRWPDPFAGSGTNLQSRIFGARQEGDEAAVSVRREAEQVGFILKLRRVLDQPHRAIHAGKVVLQIILRQIERQRECREHPTSKPSHDLEVADLSRLELVHSRWPLV